MTDTPIAHVLREARIYVENAALGDNPDPLRAQEVLCQLDQLINRFDPWRPIADAPKDGSHFLLTYRHGHRDRFVAEGWWVKRTGSWSTPHEPMVRAIAWMPLPPAVEEEKPYATNVGHSIQSTPLAKDDSTA